MFNKLILFLFALITSHSTVFANPNECCRGENIIKNGICRDGNKTIAYDLCAPGGAFILDREVQGQRNYFIDDFDNLHLESGSPIPKTKYVCSKA